LQYIVLRNIYAILIYPFVMLANSSILYHLDYVRFVFWKMMLKMQTT